MAGVGKQEAQETLPHSMQQVSRQESGKKDGTPTEVLLTTAYPQEGYGWLMPNGHDYVLGRQGWPIAPYNFLGRTLEHLPISHTFASFHDPLVGRMRDAGVPDLFINFPSMPFVFAAAIGFELANSGTSMFNRIFHKNVRIPFMHSHNPAELP